MTGASGGGAVSLDANTFQPLRPFLNCISQPHSLLCTLFLGGHTQIPNYPFFNSNIAKGTTDPRVEFISQDHSSQFTNLEQIAISES